MGRIISWTDEERSILKNIMLDTLSRGGSYNDAAHEFKQTTGSERSVGTIYAQFRDQIVPTCRDEFEDAMRLKAELTESDYDENTVVLGSDSDKRTMTQAEFMNFMKGVVITDSDSERLRERNLSLSKRVRELESELKKVRQQLAKVQRVIQGI